MVPSLTVNRASMLGSDGRPCLHPGVAVPLFADLAAAAEGRVVESQVRNPHEQRPHRLKDRTRYGAHIVWIGIGLRSRSRLGLAPCGHAEANWS